MRKQIETIRQQATLTCDANRSYRVFCDISVFQAYVTTDGYGGKQHSPAGFEIVGTIRPENLPAFIPVGQESNILDFGRGRKLDINFKGQLLESFKNKAFSIRDELTFFQTPHYEARTPD